MADEAKTMPIATKEIVAGEIDRLATLAVDAIAEFDKTGDPKAVYNFNANEQASRGVFGATSRAMEYVGDRMGVKPDQEEMSTERRVGLKAEYVAAMEKDFDRQIESNAQAAFELIPGIVRQQAKNAHSKKEDENPEFTQPEKICANVYEAAVDGTLDKLALNHRELNGIINQPEGRKDLVQSLIEYDFNGNDETLREMLAAYNLGEGDINVPKLLEDFKGEFDSSLANVLTNGGGKAQANINEQGPAAGVNIGEGSEKNKINTGIGEKAPFEEKDYKSTRPDIAKLEKVRKKYKYEIKGELKSNITELDEFLKIIQPLINQVALVPIKGVYAVADYCKDEIAERIKNRVETADNNKKMFDALNLTDKDGNPLTIKGNFLNAVKDQTKLEEAFNRDLLATLKDLHEQNAPEYHEEKIIKERAEEELKAYLKANPALADKSAILLEQFKEQEKEKIDNGTRPLPAFTYDGFPSANGSFISADPIDDDLKIEAFATNIKARFDDYYKNNYEGKDEKKWPSKEDVLNWRAGILVGLHSLNLDNNKKRVELVNAMTSKLDEMGLKFDYYIRNMDSENDRIINKKDKDRKLKAGDGKKAFDNWWSERQAEEKEARLAGMGGISAADWAKYNAGKANG
ncbi:MAG: hypothetical protein FWD15_02110 [Alphaproteobacteria bacterium]|nr:hypothetical protein [Alphaproteobacteria bacterium]